MGGVEVVFQPVVHHCGSEDSRHVFFVLTQNCFKPQEEKLASKKYSKPSTIS